MIPLLWDVNTAITVIRWCAENGYRHVMILVINVELMATITLNTIRSGKSVDSGIMIHFHSGPGPMENFGPDFPETPQMIDLARWVFMFQK